MPLEYLASLCMQGKIIESCRDGQPALTTRGKAEGPAQYE